MDEQRKDIPEVERVLGKYADRIAKLETVLDYWPPDGSKNNLNVTTVLNVVGAILLGLIAFMGSGALNRLDGVVQENIKLVARIERVTWWIETLQRQHDALEKEVRDMRERAIAERARSGK